MNEKLKFIKSLCDERFVTNDFIENENVVRIYPTSFEKSTLSKADLWEYVFKLKNPRLDTRHSYIKTKDGISKSYTDIYVSEE